MNVEYNVDLSPIEVKRHRSRYELTDLLIEFQKSDNGNMQLSYEKTSDAENDAACAYVWVKRNNADMIVSRRKKVLYIIKKTSPDVDLILSGEPETTDYLLTGKSA